MPGFWQDAKILAEPQPSAPPEFEQAIHFKSFHWAQQHLKEAPMNL
jgi:hypothetical protein